jgi:hypothetical protein
METVIHATLACLNCLGATPLSAVQYPVVRLFEPHCPFHSPAVIHGR